MRPMRAATEKPDDLFAASAPAPTGAAVNASEPLATRMRPRTLDEYVGQTHLLGPGKLLRRAIEADRLYSALFYGPPGTGKTSLAEVIARATKARFERLSGVESTVADIRRVIASAANRLHANPQARTILFIDEIHRFNRAQQDALLPDVERGTVRLLGATTENPFFAVNGPLVSRSQIFQLEPLSPADLRTLLTHALQDVERGLGRYRVRLAEDAAEHLATISDGDARKCLNAFEVGVLTTPAGADGVIDFTRDVAEESIQRKAVVYDPTGDGHYDTISAYIKSMRGSDPDAAIYWLAKMLYAGEDIRFIARRLVICAAEDVGLADAQALVVAVAAQQAAEFVGLPEAQLPLAQATIYIATAPKSNRSTVAIAKASGDVKAGVTLPVPAYLRSSAYQGSQRLGHGEGYQYSHDSPEAYVPQAYLPEGRRYYEPSDRGSEKRIAERLAHWRALFEQAQADKEPRCP
jgi:putative ATPase